MSVETLTLTIPSALFQRLKDRARQTRRSVEDETVDLLATAVPGSDALPADLAAAVSPLSLLDDEALWRAARSRLAADAAERLEELHVKRQGAGLTADEEQAAAFLLRQYERSMIIRSQAAALLHERGHAVDELAIQP